MTYSRRELSLMLAAFAVDDHKGELPAKCWTFESLPVKTNPTTHNQTRNVFDGHTHAGCQLDLHITTLAPGQMPHPPHRHVSEEILLIQEGTLDVTISGKTERLGPGGVAYVHSNELHGWKNVGDGPAQYFVLATGKEKGVA
jgi:quercetin dioxygenase-like cupin family protein